MPHPHPGSLARAGATPPHPGLGPQLMPDRPTEPATAQELDRCEQRLGSPLPPALRRFLQTWGGGSFGGGLLQIMGACRPVRHDDLATWNQPHDWKAAFAGYDLDQTVFFADDIFGNQFGYRPDSAEPAVLRFDIQLGEWTEVAPTVTAFLEEALPDEGAWLLGADFVQAYRECGHDLEAGHQLSLIVPSLLGGTLAPENLRPLDPSTNLYVAGQVVTRIKPLPPGTEVRGFRIDRSQKSIHFETRFR